MALMSLLQSCSEASYTLTGPMQRAFCASALPQSLQATILGALHTFACPWLTLSSTSNSISIHSDHFPSHSWSPQSVQSLQPTSFFHSLGFLSSCPSSHPLSSPQPPSTMAFVRHSHASRKHITNIPAANAFVQGLPSLLEVTVLNLVCCRPKV